MSHTEVLSIIQKYQSKRVVYVVLFCTGLIILGFVLYLTKVKSYNAPVLPQTIQITNAVSYLTSIGDSTKPIVLKEGNILYIGTTGGVIVEDATTGEVLKQITGANGIVNESVTSLVKINNNLYIGTQDGFEIYNVITTQLTHIGTHEGLLSGSNIELYYPANNGNILWVNTFGGLCYFNIQSQKITRCTNNQNEESQFQNTTYPSLPIPPLRDRPQQINSILAIIDGSAFIDADHAIWKYSPNTMSFKRLFDIKKDELIVTFQPLANTSKVLFISQHCTTECDNPNISLYDYSNNTQEDMSTAFTKAIATNPPSLYPIKDYIPALYTLTYDLKNKEVAYLDLGGFGTKYYFHTDSLQWSTNGVDPNITFGDEPVCNNVYYYKPNRFTSVTCLYRTAEGKGYIWHYSLGKTYGDDDILTQSLQGINNFKSISVPKTPATYSPFPHSQTGDHYEITKLIYAQNYLWVGSNDGLAILNPITKQWTLLGDSNVLMDQNVHHIFIDEGYAYIQTDGGITIFKFK